MATRRNYHRGSEPLPAAHAARTEAFEQIEPAAAPREPEWAGQLLRIRYGDLDDDYSQTDYGPRRYTHPQGGAKLRSAASELRRSDERMRAEIWERLRRAPQLDLSDLELSVNAGEAYLSGTLGDRKQKHLAENLAAEVSGVIDVHNRVRLRRLPGPAAVSGTTQARRQP